MKRHPKLSQPQQEHLASGRHTASQGAQDFADTNEMLRYDAARTLVPPEIARRLQKSLDENPTKRSWWQKLIGL
jgi:hypothetical protein